MSYFDDLQDGAFEGDDVCIDLLGDLGEDYEHCRDFNNTESEATNDN
jgi:hypothetical protein